MRSHFIRSDLLNKKVHMVVVGAGGTGSLVLEGLAKLHLAMLALGHPHGLHVTVVDDDYVSEANVGRQGFYPSDVGLPKATVLANRINMTYGFDWKAVITRVTSDQTVHGVDIVIGCVDNRKARKAILDVFQGCYWLDIGNREDTGQVVLGEIPRKWGRYNPDRLPHAAELFPEVIDEAADAEDDTPSCSLAEALEKQSLFVNRGVALYALNLLHELFRYGKLDYHGVFVNMRASRTSTLMIDPEVWQRMGYTHAAPSEEVA
jgi:PRTRC genetic system ThiF family protein